MNVGIVAIAKDEERYLAESDSTSIAQINHYFCKSWQEFNWKINRGRATTVNEFRKTDDFEWSNRNDVLDLTATKIRDKNKL